LLCFTRALTRFYPDPGPKPAKILEIDGFFEVHSPWDFVAEKHAICEPLYATLCASLPYEFIAFLVVCRQTAKESENFGFHSWGLWARTK
jgi:hypothetical protein